MPRERIYSEPLTNAEKQARYRQKHRAEPLDPLEAENRRRWKLQDELNGYINRLSIIQLLSIKPLLRCLAEFTTSPEDMQKLLDTIGDSIDYEMCIGEYADSD